MKISIHTNNETFSWESEKDSYTITEVVYQLKGILVAAGYHPKNVDEQFAEDAWSWFPEKEEDVELPDN